MRSGSRSRAAGARGLADTARALADSGRLNRGLVAIDGPSGVGKSTFADALTERLTELGRPVLLIRTDEYATWDDPAAWWPELERDVLRPFRAGRDIVYRPRVWTGRDAEPGPPVTRRWAPLLIIEGVTSARRSVSAELAGAFWLQGPGRAERLARAVARDGAEDRDLFAAWQRFEQGWFAVDDTRARCMPLDVDDVV